VMYSRARTRLSLVTCVERSSSASASSAAVAVAAAKDVDVDLMDAEGLAGVMKA